MNNRNRLVTLIAAGLVLANERGTRFFNRALTKKVNRAKRHRRKITQASKRKNRR